MSNAERVAAIGDWIVIQGQGKPRTGYVKGIFNNKCIIAIVDVCSPTSQYEATTEFITVSVLELSAFGVGRWSLQEPMGEE